jgi:anthranilate synthase component 1
MLLQKLEHIEPLKLYSFLREEGEFPFILESAEKNAKRARFTYISANPVFIIEIGGKGTKINGKKVSEETNPFRALSKLTVRKRGGERFVGGFVGYIAYDAVHNYIGGRIEEPSVFAYFDNVFVYDNLHRRLYYTGNPEEVERIISEAKKVDYTYFDQQSSKIIGCDAEKKKFIEMVVRAKEHIYEGDAFQIVISREYELKSSLSPFQAYLNLRRVNPSPYMFLLEFDKVVGGSSPETMASVMGNILKINPIAGTTMRGKSCEEDEELAKQLLSDEKERAEHVMLVDLARNDVRKVCEPGSITVTRFFEVIKYSYVQHIESEVVGIIQKNITPFDAIEASFPAGTLTGAPKIRAMEIIDEIEASRRRIYGGCVGYFSSNGWADMAIAIRMFEIDHVWRVRAGAGVVADSDPKMEYEETERKMVAVLRALNLIFPGEEYDRGCR